MPYVLPRTAPAPRRASLISIAQQLVSLHRQRRALLSLDDQQLEDIGLSRVQAESEARRRFWDLPQHGTC